MRNVRTKKPGNSTLPSPQPSTSTEGGTIQETFGLVVTPDGTRKGHSHWKSGFYRIARETGLPVTLGYVDRTTMTVGLGPTIEPGSCQFSAS